MYRINRLLLMCPLDMHLDLRFGRRIPWPMGQWMSQFLQPTGLKSGDPFKTHWGRSWWWGRALQVTCLFSKSKVDLLSQIGLGIPTCIGKLCKTIVAAFSQDTLAVLFSGACCLAVGQATKRKNDDRIFLPHQFPPNCCWQSQGLVRRKWGVGLGGRKWVTRPMTTSWALIGMTTHGSMTNWGDRVIQCEEISYDVCFEGSPLFNPGGGRRNYSVCFGFSPFQKKCT